MSGGTRPRLPNMDDDRFLAGGPELTFDFLTIYQLSARSDPKGTFPEPDAISVILYGDTSLGAYYAGQIAAMKKLHLVGFDEQGRWCILDYREWNPGWDDPAERMRQYREKQLVQAGLPIPSKSRKVEVLSAIQLARFDRLKAAYPPESYGILLQAKRAFKKADPDDEELAEMIAGVAVWRESPQWLGGRVNHLRTYITDRMWENDPPDMAYPHANGHGPKYAKSRSVLAAFAMEDD